MIASSRPTIQAALDLDLTSVDLLCYVVGIVDPVNPDKRECNEANDSEHQRDVDRLYDNKEDSLHDLPIVDLSKAGKDKRSGCSESWIFLIPRYGVLLTNSTVGTDLCLFFNDFSTTRTEDLISPLL